MAPAVKKITQSELAEYVKLEAEHEKYQKLRKSLIERHEKGALIESGELSLQVPTATGPSVKYKGAIDKLMKEMSKPIRKRWEAIKREFTGVKTTHEVIVSGSESLGE